MKKKLAILLVGTMIASSILAGCGSKKSEPTKKETSGELKECMIAHYAHWKNNEQIIK